MNSNNNSIEITFSPGIYSLDTIKKASYKFTDLLAFEFAQAPTGEIRVILAAIKEKKQDELELIAKRFKNEVLDQDLRETIAKETEGIRNLILAQAFSKTDLLSE